MPAGSGWGSGTNQRGDRQPHVPVRVHGGQTPVRSVAGGAELLPRRTAATEPSGGQVLSPV